MPSYRFAFALPALLAATACSAPTDSAQTSQIVTPNRYTVDSPKVKTLLSKFEMNSIAGTPELIDCMVTGDVETQCLSITLPLHPVSYEIGPWCPRNISEGTDTGGLWIKDGEVYEIDGEFISNLDEFYGDEEWKLYDSETGDIRYTDTLEACIAAARPDVAPEYTNNCIECSMHYLDQDYQRTWIIPIDPVKLDIADSSGVNERGVAFSGVLLNGRAPVEAIISHKTIAAFDDCGGHANPNEGYHIHLVVEDDECLKTIASTGTHAPEIGIAMDGYMMHTRKNLDGTVPSDLDNCLGHETDGLGYHYHVNTTGSNAILGCLSGRASTVLAGNTHGPMGGPPGGGMGGPPGAGGMGPPPSAHGGHDDGH